jgi:hypothetical protein
LGGRLLAVPKLLLSLSVVGIDYCAPSAHGEGSAFALLQQITRMGAVLGFKYFLIPRHHFFSFLAVLIKFYHLSHAYRMPSQALRNPNVVQMQGDCHFANGRSAFTHECSPPYARTCRPYARTFLPFARMLFTLRTIVPTFRANALYLTRKRYALSCECSPPYARTLRPFARMLSTLRANVLSLHWCGFHS